MSHAPQSALERDGHLGRDFLALMIAGGVAEIIFEILAWGVMPALFGFALQPAFLVDALSTAYLGLPLGYPAAFAVHVLAGVVLFPVLYRLMTGMLNRPNTWIAGGFFGVLLWFLAQGILAPLAGRSFMMGWGAFTWASLIAHVIYGLVLALAYRQTRGWCLSRP